MPRPPAKNSPPNVAQDSSVIRIHKPEDNGRTLDTLSKVESAYPPKALGSTLPAVSLLKREDDEYHMAHRFRGEAIILNHYKYDDNLGLSVRDGTDVDQASLENIFRELRFSVRVHQDKTYREIKDILEEVRTNEYMYIADCLVVVVLTHGDKGNSLFARDSLYSASELWDPFLAHMCPVLATKPKIFIIQACRGDAVSTRVDINKEATTTTDSTKTVTEGIPNGEYFSIPTEADILIAYSSFEGRVAFRDTSKGTWYISELCNEILANWERDDLMTMLTRVNRRVAIDKEDNTSKQMPSIQSTLTRKIFFSDKRKTTETCGEDVPSDVVVAVAAVTETKPTQETAPKIWNGLRISSPQLVSQTYPDNKEVLRLAKGLRIFIEEGNLNPEIHENASLLLVLLSLWESLDSHARHEAYGKLISFLHTHASQWKYFDILGLPEKQGETPRSRRSSSASTQNQRAGTLPRRKPPFKH